MIRVLERIYPGGIRSRFENPSPDRLPGRMLDSRRRARGRRHGSIDEVAMRREMTRWRAMANAVFVLGVLGLAGYGVRQVASCNWAWQPTFHARAGFSAIGGIEVGAKVRVQGIDAGVVEKIEPPKQPGGPVVLRLRLDERLHPLVRSDATARIVPQSLVGVKVVEIVPGKPESPMLIEDGALSVETP